MRGPTEGRSTLTARPPRTRRWPCAAVATTASPATTIATRTVSLVTPALPVECRTLIRERVTKIKSRLLDPIRNPHFVRPVVVRRSEQQRGRVERVHHEAIDTAAARDPGALVGAVTVVGHWDPPPSRPQPVGVAHMEEHEARRREPRARRVRHGRHHLHGIIDMEPGDAVGHVEQLSGIGDLDEQRVVAIDLHVADRDGLSARIYHGPILRRELHGPPSAGLRAVAHQYGALRHAISQWLGGGVEDAVGGRIDQEQTGEGDVVLDSGRVTLNRYVPMVNGPWATRHDAQPTPERRGRSAD